MKFETIRLKNWKNFASIQIDLSDRVFIVGANASGKSNLLDAFRFLKDTASSGFLKAVETRGGIKKIRYLNARNNNQIEVEVHLLEITSEGIQNKWEYLLQFNSTGSEHGNPNISIERISKNDAVLCIRKYNDEKEDYTSKQYTHLEQPAINGTFRELFDCFRSISYVNVIPQLIKEADSFIPSMSSEDFYGRNLLDTMASTPSKIRKTRLNTISRVLKLAVPQLSALQYVQDEKGRPHLQVKYEHFRPQGAYQMEDQLSDGTLRLIGILWAVLSGDDLMLLEEPELYLHSAIVQQLPAFIANA